uniref:Uncharacterized protein n=1 Tax=Anguilla anguilla TaxID=7936 RepID=A0A0E9XY10_ANGAN
MYFITVLKYLFQVSLLYSSVSIWETSYFHFTTFQTLISYFLLHYFCSISVCYSLLSCGEN